MISDLPYGANLRSIGWRSDICITIEDRKDVRRLVYTLNHPDNSGNINMFAWRSLRLRCRLNVEYRVATEVEVLTQSINAKTMSARSTKDCIWRRTTWRTMCQAGDLDRAPCEVVSNSVQIVMKSNSLQLEWGGPLWNEGWVGTEHETTPRIYRHCRSVLFCCSAVRGAKSRVIGQGRQATSKSGKPHHRGIPVAETNLIF